MLTSSNDLTEKLKIEYPIIQAPMLGVSTPEMAAIVSNQWWTWLFTCRWLIARSYTTAYPQNKKSHQ